MKVESRNVPEFTRIRIDTPAPHVFRITLARPARRNAQDYQMLYEFDDALKAAGLDDEIRVVILAADGPDFSSGHDLKAGSWETPPTGPRVHFRRGGEQVAVDVHMNLELEAFVGLSLRWRDFPKPTIAQVQGRCIAGGLALVWPCDIVIAGETASFRDPTVDFGFNGQEYFTHVWEVGPRTAKEMLFTGDAISAADAKALGMVNHVVPDAELEARTLDLATRIARKPLFALQLAKMAVNQTLDIQGQTTALRNAFNLHHVGHAHNMHRYGEIVPPGSADSMKANIKAQSRK